MLILVKFMKGNADMEMYDRVTAPGFSHGAIKQERYSSVLRIGESVEEFTEYKIVWSKNLQQKPFQQGAAWYEAGSLKVEAYIVDSYPEKDWVLDYEIQLIVDYHRKYHL